MTERAGGEQRIQRGSTQTVRSYPRIGPAGTRFLEPLASCTAVVRQPSGGISDSRTATRDQLSTSVLTAAREGDTALEIATLSVYTVEDVVDGRSLIVAPVAGEAFEVETVQAEDVDAATMLAHLAEPLPVGVPVGTPVRGWQVSLPLTTDETSDLGTGYVEWTGTTLAGDSFTWLTPFLVVKRVVSWTLSVPRLTQAYPVIATMLSHHDTTGAELIEAAWHHRVLPRLAARGILGEQIASPEAVEPLHALACLLHLVEPDPVQTTEYVDRLQTRFDSVIEELVGRSDWWTIPAQAEDVPTRVLEQQPTRIVRVSR